MKKILVGLALVLVPLLTMATPAFAQEPDKTIAKEIAPGLSGAARHHCCNPGQEGPANAADVFESKFGLNGVW